MASKTEKLTGTISRIILEYDGRGHPSEVKYGAVADQILKACKEARMVFVVDNVTAWGVEPIEVE